MIGSFFGAMILGTLQKIIYFCGLKDAYWADMANGVMLGIFIILQSVILTIRGKGKISVIRHRKTGGNPPDRLEKAELRP